MVDWRTTWCGIHWLGWVSFITLTIGVAGLMSALALSYFYTFSDPNWNAKADIGLWSFCVDIAYIFKLNGGTTTFTSLGCFPIDNSCKSIDGVLEVTDNCSQFHAITAVLVLACIFGGLAVFVNWAALGIMLAHGSISTFVVKMGGLILSMISGGLGVLTMILLISEKDSLFPQWRQYKAPFDVNYHASFAVLIIGWIFILISAVTFVISARRCGGGFHTEGDGQKGNYTDDV